MKVYWANAIFSEADRAFNRNGVDRLRSAGFDACSPQEFGINATDHDPAPCDVFRLDTRALLAADVVVACLDAESIDAGVACEVGVAFAWGIPVLGLCTDFRQDRSGSGRMYKNLYVLGALTGASCRTVDDVLSRLSTLQQRTTQHGPCRRATGRDTSPGFLWETMACSYDPPWTVADRIAPLLGDRPNIRLLDLGCGSGHLAQDLFNRGYRIDYVGHDVNITALQPTDQRHHLNSTVYTHSWDDVLTRACTKPFDLVVAGFVLHDNPWAEALSAWASLLDADSQLIIIDLTTEDLPRSTDLIRRLLARPALCPDPRLTPAGLSRVAAETGLTVLSWDFDFPSVRFRDPDFFMAYCEAAGIFSGADLPLGLDVDHAEKRARIVRDSLKGISWPLLDRRAFATCTLARLKND